MKPGAFSSPGGVGDEVRAGGAGLGVGPDSRQTRLVGVAQPGQDPELKGCQSQGDTIEEAVANIREAIELYLETLPPDQRDRHLSQEILTTTVEVDV